MCCKSTIRISASACESLLQSWRSWCPHAYDIKFITGCSLLITGLFVNLNRVISSVSLIGYRLRSMERIAGYLWIHLGVLLIVVNSQAKVDAAICSDAVCMFELNVSFVRTMTYRDKDGGLNSVFLDGVDLRANVSGQVITLTPSDVIIADGFERDIIVFNGQLPGPTIEVMEGSLIVVTVNNLMRQKVLTVHWHGMFQNNTYFMDGAEGFTQYPILPGQSFIHRFRAQPEGTHWYHAHLSTMRLDGLFGMLIVHKSLPKIPYFPIIVNDWNHVPSEEMELSITDLCENGAIDPPLNTPGQPLPDCSFDGAELDPGLYTSSLFDGLNRWQNQPFPLKFYVVTSGGRYRFRMVNAGHIFPFQIQIDGHPLTIVASDGAEIEPIIVDSFFIVVAESIDFEINADQPPGRYWIRADTQCNGAFARGKLAYDGFENSIEDPVSQPRDCTPEAPCRVFNCPFGRYPDGSNRVCLAISGARSTLSRHELEKQYGIGDEDVIELFLNFAMVAGPSINGRRFMMPRVPLFKDPLRESDCSGEPCLDGCKCRCTGIQTLPYGRTVRLIISNLQPDPNVVQDMYHMFHMHGHRVAVMAQKFPSYDSTSGRIVSPNTDISCGSDVLCAQPRWSSGRPSFHRVQYPAIKDTISIPIRGYVVLQFRTDNPGYWMLHCHIDMHTLAGMATAFKIATDRFPNLPPEFPVCDDVIPNCDGEPYC